MREQYELLYVSWLCPNGLPPSKLRWHSPVLTEATMRGRLGLAMAGGAEAPMSFDLLPALGTLHEGKPERWLAA